MRAIASGLTDVGLQRDHNEDSYAVLSEYDLFIVADGMGGHRAGDVASRMASLPSAYAGASNEWESAIATADCEDAFYKAYDEATAILAGDGLLTIDTTHFAGSGGQIKIESATAGTVYIDNIHFWGSK